MSETDDVDQRVDEPIIDLTNADVATTGDPAATSVIRGSGDNVVLLLSGDPQTDEPLVVRLQEALDAAQEMILVIEPSGRTLFANRIARTQLGLDHPDAVFRPAEALLSGSRREEVWRALDDAHEWRGELSATRTDGSTVQLDTTMLADRTATGDIHSLTIVAHDIGEQRALEQALEHQATHDGLTGLNNRQHLLRELDDALADLHERKAPGSLLLIDIDEFRTVTNSLGHDAGDRILIAFAYRLLRTFPTNALLARVGGDEFAVFCPGTDDVDHLTAQIDRTTTAPFYIDGSEVHLSVVTGIAVAAPSRPLHTGEELLREADAAAYRGKERGRGAHELFRPQLQADAADRLALVRELRRALRNNEFRVHYQPKIDLTTGRITGAEALVRWETPDGELRSPAAFLDVAEDTGLIIPLGRWVLEQACSTLLRISEQLPDHPPLEVSVNLSVRQLSHPSFVEELSQVVQESGVDPRHIELEITESALMDDVQASADLLHRLKRLGTQIAVDDFGTGYSSLQYLQRLPVDVLKIDRSFVAGLEGEEGDRAIVTAVIHLAQALRLRSVAEGVETSGQLEQLRMLDCGHAQGYHISRPMVEDDLVNLIERTPTW